MCSERRSKEDLIFFAILPIVINIATNVVYFISGGSYEILKVVDDFNAFTVVSILICCLFNLFTRGRKLSEDEKKEFNKKMYGLKLLSIVFIGYIIFTIFIVRNVTTILSSFIMFAGYINLYIFKSKSRTIDGLSETQRNWRKFHNKPIYDESNLLWKIKPMLASHVSVRFTERIKHINWISLIFILPLLSDFRLEVVPMMVIVFMLLIKDIVYFADVILGLYTETEGTCTGIVMKERSRGSREEYSQVYYEVYVTDFSNKRELKFNVYDYCNYNEDDIVKLTHGGLSKKVIESKIVSK